MEKKDLKVRDRISEQTIKKCFLEMLKKQPVESIHVGKLCEKAGINRSTFYRHYEDIYALLDSVVDDCLRDLFHSPVSSLEPGGDFEELGYGQILRVLETTIEKKQLYQMLLFGRTNTKLVEKMTESVYQFYKSAHASVSRYRDSDEISLQYRFLANGIIGVWFTWIRDDCRLPKETVAETAKQQISAFFRKMNELYL